MSPVLVWVAFTTTVLLRPVTTTFSWLAMAVDWEKARAEFGP